MNCFEIMAEANRRELMGHGQVVSLASNEETRSMVRELLGDGLDEVMRGCVTTVFKQVQSDSPIPEEYFLSGALSYLIQHEKIAQWAQQMGDTEVVDLGMYLGVVAAVAKDYANEKGWTRQIGLTVEPIMAKLEGSHTDTSQEVDYSKR